MSKYGELEQVLGDKWNKTDSLIVHGPINETDFKTMVRCARYGILRIINLQYAQVENHKIPYCGFADRELASAGYYLDIDRVILPDDITEFGDFAFANLTLRKVNIPSSLKKLGEGCFYLDKWLDINPIVFPEGVTEIPSHCFLYASKVKAVVLPSTIKTISNAAFNNTYISELILPEGLDSIGIMGLGSSSFKELILPNSVKRLGKNALYDNHKLKRVVLPKGLTEIPEGLCCMCRELEDVEIPANVRTVKRETFRHCEKLKIALPYGLERIEALAFEDCLADSIVLPSTVKYLEGAPFRHIQGLKKIYALAETPPVCTIDPQKFTQDINPFAGSAPKGIPIYVPIGSAEKYRKAAGWDYFTNFIETSKLPAGIETPQMGSNEPYKVYGKDGKLVIELPVRLASPVRYSVCSIAGATIAQGYLTASHTLQIPESGIYVVRIGNAVYKILL
ncbi:hypothetical protein JCM15124A_00410 [Prevotella falsenii]